MASTPQARLKRDVLSGSEGRHPPLHILFVHSHLAEVERCLQELNKMHFTVSAEIVGTPEEFRSTLPRLGRKCKLRNLPLRPRRQISRSERGHGENARVCLKGRTARCKPRE